ncbi:methionine--tRNA ligase MSM1 [Nakaseomyces bracarensis]|uniref:methionine--tRNA ligase MSM1 n=1 Tax=Nakaseomyces bracarensis TaxID=273131 RepID=UPI0038722D94
MLRLRPRSGGIHLLRCYSSQSHVTTPIFYPNAKPHLGHLYSSLLCDIYHRWKILNGDKEALFTTGTDEHGLKIQLAAEKNSFDNPRAFVDQLIPEFKELDREFDIKYTRFIRTTDQDHLENVKKLWLLCLDAGYIYKGQHQGWYSISDETFYPESKVIKDPKNEGKYINTESNNEVIFQSEENYYFKLSAFKDRLIAYIESNPDFIHPPSKKNQILRDLKNDSNASVVKDISISRPSTRLQWGIEVPNDSTQKVYVWFDALCNYLTSVGGIVAILQNQTTKTVHKVDGSQITLKTPAKVWSNTIHLIGKDIEKFHIIFWPSFLMAANIPLPKKIVVHNHWLCNGVKMSKSLGNVVEPLLMSTYYGADMVRWFLMENSKLEEDGDFQEDKLFSTTELFASKWGNLINRCSGSKFNIQRSVEYFTQDNKDLKRIFQEIFSGETELLNTLDDISNNLSSLPSIMENAYDRFQPNMLIKTIWDIINDTNALFQLSQPWKRSGKQQDAIIFFCIDITRILAISTQPIIPQLSNKFLDHLAVDVSRRGIEYLPMGTDNNYGINVNLKKGEVPIQRIKKRHS